MTCGEVIRNWRRRRRMTQLDLALAVGVSTRHLSFVETGRSRPSRTLVIALGEALDIPLAARNQALLAAGFAPRYSAHNLDDEPMRAVRAALETVLAAHEPYPAIVLGAGFELLAANAGAVLLVDGVDEALLDEPINVMRLCLHPDGLARRLINFGEVRASILTRVRRAYERSGDPHLRELHAELSSYSGPAGMTESDTAPEVFIPFRLRTEDGAELAFITTLTAFGGPQDVVLESLALEAFYPRDDDTRAQLSTATQASRERIAEVIARMPHLASYLAVSQA